MALLLLRRLTRLAHAVAGWILPPACEVCGCALTDTERFLCLGCLAALPRTRYHLMADENDIHHRLSDNHILVERAASMFHYYRGSAESNLILSAKYRRRPSVLTVLGQAYAAEIAPSGFFAGIDAIVPVPVHWTRRMARGYNQTDYLARGLSLESGVTVAHDILSLPHRHSTQTRRSAMSRAANVKGAYRARAEARSLRGRPDPHLLVVDDIITTGATMRDCLRALHEAIPRAKLSVLSIGLAHCHS
ncbi:MAG: hypothetical protein NC342_07540 [Pseudoflavonifractor sp.]|nr:ComF family protein [Alloprevotella sp.]MCM1117372.1 hypothetical protein [Pseudoflavonifractor sp.]